MSPRLDSSGGSASSGTDVIVLAVDSIESEVIWRFFFQKDSLFTMLLDNGEFEREPLAVEAGVVWPDASGSKAGSGGSISDVVTLVDIDAASSVTVLLRESPLCGSINRTCGPSAVGVPSVTAMSGASPLGLGSSDTADDTASDRVDFAGIFAANALTTADARASLARGTAATLLTQYTS